MLAEYPRAQEKSPAPQDTDVSIKHGRRSVNSKEAEKGSKMLFLFTFLWIWGIH